MQDRWDRLVGTVERKAELQLTEPDADWGDVPVDFEELQREDETLQKAYDKVNKIEEVSTEVLPALSGESYLVREELLYHQPGEGRAEQLVVPKQLRERVLAMGHKIPS